MVQVAYGGTPLFYNTWESGCQMILAGQTILKVFVVGAIDSLGMFLGLFHCIVQWIQSFAYITQALPLLEYGCVVRDPHLNSAV